MILRCVLQENGDSKNQEPEVAVIPALQSGNRTAYVSDPSKQAELYAYLESLSIGIKIGEDGYAIEGNDK